MKKLVLAFVVSASVASASILTCSGSTTDAGLPALGTEAGADVVTPSDAPADAPKDVAAAVAPEARSDGSAA